MYKINLYKNLWLYHYSISNGNTRYLRLSTTTILNVSEFLSHLLHLGIFVLFQMEQKCRYRIIRVANLKFLKLNTSYEKKHSSGKYCFYWNCVRKKEKRKKDRPIYTVSSILPHCEGKYIIDWRNVQSGSPTKAPPTSISWLMGICHIYIYIYIKFCN